MRRLIVWRVDPPPKFSFRAFYVWNRIVVLREDTSSPPFLALALGNIFQPFKKMSDLSLSGILFDKDVQSQIAGLFTPSSNKFLVIF